MKITVAKIFKAVYKSGVEANTERRKMQKQVEIVLYQHNNRWYWAINVNGRTDEDCKNSYGSAVLAARFAQIAYDKHFALI